jgi:hypothetical protein
VNTYLSRVPRLSLHLMAFGWSSAVLYTLAAWPAVNVPFWLFALAYLLPALLRPRGNRLSIVAAVVVAAASALVVQSGNLFFAIIFLLLQSTRALTLPQQATVAFLRVEQRRGMIILLLVVLARALVGRPSPWLIGLSVALYLVGALAGLPLAHSREAGDTRPGSARPGLRISVAIAAVAAVIAAIIGAVRFAAQHHVFDFLQPVLAAIFKPIAYVIGYVVQFFVGLILGHHPKLPKQQKSKIHTPQPRLPQRTHSAVFMHRLDIILIVLAVLVIAAIVYLLYRRLQVREIAESPDANLPGKEEDIVRSAVQRRHAPDYGEGARRMVRRTVGLHVRRHDLPPGTTARSYARSQGWDDEWVATYEHARYGFVEPFPEQKAREFVAAFIRRFGRRRRRGPTGQ